MNFAMADPSKLRLAAVQLAPVLGDCESNLARHLEWIATAREQGADLVVFPELSLTGYQLKDMVPDVALRLGGAELAPLREASETIGVVVGLVEETPEHALYNAVVLLQGGEVVARHRKVYLPTYGMFDEMRYFAAGDRLGAVDTAFGRLALCLCEDFWHPSTAYIGAQDGAKLFIVPSCSPARGFTDEDRFRGTQVWELLNRHCAAAYGVFVCFVNRVGYEDGVNYWGGSEVIVPGGGLVAKAPYFDEHLLLADLDWNALRRERIATPLIRDERLDITLRELRRISRARWGKPRGA
jgi:predicted amidohydrolase